MGILKIRMKVIAKAAARIMFLPFLYSRRDVLDVAESPELSQLRLLQHDGALYFQILELLLGQR